MAAVTPAAIAVSKPSGNGKKASLASTEPAAPSPALSTAMRTLSSRLGWPLPTPVNARFRASTMAFDLTCRTACQANARSSISWALGSRAVTTCQDDGSAGAQSAVCTSSPPAIGLTSQLVTLPSPMTMPTARACATDAELSSCPASRWSRRRIPAQRRLRRRSPHAPRRLAVDGAVERDDAAERRNRVAPQGLVERIARSSRSASPQGMVCLTMATAGRVNPCTAFQAASASRRLLNDSSLPASCSASSTPGAGSPARSRR